MDTIFNLAEQVMSEIISEGRMDNYISDTRFEGYIFNTARFTEDIIEGVAQLCYEVAPDDVKIEVCDGDGAIEEMAAKVGREELAEYIKNVNWYRELNSYYYSTRGV